MAMLVPVRAPVAKIVPSPPQAPFDDAATHKLKCIDPKCAQCRFYSGFEGRLRKGSSKTTHAPAEEHAWGKKNMFFYPADGQWHPWICVRPTSWGGGFAAGCFVCNAAGKTCTFGSVEVRGLSMMQSSAWRHHASMKSHLGALESLRSSTGRSSGQDQPVGPVSGISDGVPHLKKWVDAMTVLAGHQGKSAFQRHATSGGVGSFLTQTSTQGDDSKQAFVKMVASSGTLLRRVDHRVLGMLKKSSVAIDERDQVLLAFGRMLTTKGDLYESLYGLARDYGTGHEKCLAALEDILKRFCTAREGPRGEDLIDGPGDKLLDEAYQKLRSSMKGAASDSGPTECKALYESSRLAKSGAQRADPLFPNLGYIFRDAPHRYRTVQKAFWAHLPQTILDFLNLLLKGEGGDKTFARMVETSSKFRQLFLKYQKEQPMDARVFLKELRNFSFTECRFNSRSEPLFKIFMLLPVAFAVLEYLALNGTPSEQELARALLVSCSGEAGYATLVGAALVGDIMVVMQRAIRLEDGNDGDVSLLPSEAASLRDTLKNLLHDGAIWLEESKGTLVHAALTAIRNQKSVFFKEKAGGVRVAPVGWPAPNQVGRCAPMKQAKDLWNQWETYFDLHFPMWEVQNSFAAFDLEAPLTMSDRKLLLQALAIHSKVDKEAVWGAFAGAQDILIYIYIYIYNNYI